MSTDIQLCGKCGAERSYIDYHIMYNPCRVYVKKHSVNHYFNHRQKLMKKQKLHF